MTDTATVTITIQGQNDAPIALDDLVSTDEDSLLAADLLVSNGIGPDSDPEGDALTVVAVNGSGADAGNQISLPSGALLTVFSNGQVSYDPNGSFEHLAAGQSEMDLFAYTVDDGNGGAATATVTVTVMGENDIPTTTGIPPVDVAENADPSILDLSQYFDDPEDGPGGLAYTVEDNSNLSLFSSVIFNGAELTLNYASGAFGTAVLRISAADSGDPALSVEVDLMVTVTRTYATWQDFQFGAATLAQAELEATVWGDLADPDGDLIVNLLEYFMGLDPLFDDRGGLLAFDLVGSELILVAQRAVGLTDVDGVFEWSEDLVAWLNTDIAVSVVPNGVDIESLEARLTVGANDLRRFLRLRVFLVGE